MLHNPRTGGTAGVEAVTCSWVRSPFTTALICCWLVWAVRLAMQQAMLCCAVLLVSGALPAARRDDSMLSKVTAEEPDASTAGKKASTSSRAAPCKWHVTSHGTFRKDIALLQCLHTWTITCLIKHQGAI